MSKVVGYARVSSHEQNLDRQIQALSQYVKPDMIVSEKASGKDFNRPGYQSLKVGIGKLVKGDTLYIKSLDRLSRNKEQAKKELQYFKDNGIRIKIIDLPTTMAEMPQEQAWIADMVSNIMIEVLILSRDCRILMIPRQTMIIFSDYIKPRAKTKAFTLCRI